MHGAWLMHAELCISTVHKHYKHVANPIFSLICLFVVCFLACHEVVHDGGPRLTIPESFRLVHLSPAEDRGTAENVTDPQRIAYRYYRVI